MTPTTRSTSTSSFVPMPARLTFTLDGPLFYTCINMIYNIYFIPFHPILKVFFLIFQNFFYSPGSVLCRSKQNTNCSVYQLDAFHENRECNSAQCR